MEEMKTNTDPPSPAAETAQRVSTENCEPRTLKECAEAIVSETARRYMDCDISLVEFEQDTAIATKYLTMFAAPLRDRIAKQDAEIENLIWNLGGCDSVASGWTEPGESIAEDLARPALHSVIRMAKRLQQAEAELAALRAEHAELKATFDIRWKADMRAIKQWQRTHPGNDLVWPDHADLVVWLAEGYADLVETNCRMSRQLAALQAWKNEQLAVEREWDDQAVGRELGIPLGTSIRAGILPAIKRLKAEQASIPEKAHAMTFPELEALARAFYEGYTSASTDNLNSYPAWPQLNEIERRWWIAGARRVDANR